MTSQAPDPYDLLGVSPQASAAEITAAYRRLLRLHHPDSAPAAESDAHDREDWAAPAPAETLHKIIAAYEVLHDPARRAGYDRRRAASAPASQTRPTRPAARQGPTSSGDGWLLRAGPVFWQPEPGETRATDPRGPAGNDVFELMNGLLAALDARRRYR